MDYCVRKAETEDLPEIYRLYSRAREFMRSAGNPDQWGSTYPEEKTILSDLSGGNLYLIYDDREIHGVFAFLIFDDPTYRVIRNGSWHSQQTYGVIHRVAGDGSGGILKAAVLYARKWISYLRIDTHEKNLPMQRSIAAMGFQKCGTIYTETGAPRIAFDGLF